MVPIMKGLGYGMLTVRFFVNIYYVVIQAWAIFYLAVGFTSELPWGTCEKDFTTHDCFTLDYQADCDRVHPGNTHTFYKKGCVENEEYCLQHEYNGFADGNCTRDDGEQVTLDNVIKKSGISPAEDYFNGFVLGIVKDPEGNRHEFGDYGGLR